MRAAREAGVAGAGLNASSRPPSFPADFEGSVFQGEAAAERASQVSGPFSSSPAAYVVPSNEESLCALVRWSTEAGVPLIPRGGGTGMPGGNLGRHVVVELGEAFSEISVVSPEEGRIEAGAGAVLADVEAAAREHGLFLPFLPSSARWCRIGGMVANNGAGARSFRHGAVAASLLRVDGIFASGERFRVGAGLPVPETFRRLEAELRSHIPGLPGWPKVRKNSSGYALDRFLVNRDPAQLLAGSEGTLAFMTGVELRALPTPVARGLAVIAVGSAAELTAVALDAEELGAETCEFLGRRFLEMAAVESDPEVGHLARDAYAIALLEFAGSGEEVGAGLRAARVLGESAGAGAHTTSTPDSIARLWSLRHAASPTIAREAGRGRYSVQFIEDSVVPPARLGDYLEGLDAILRAHALDAVVFGHAGDGNVHVNPLVDSANPDWRTQVRGTLEGVVDLVASLGGTLSGEHGDGRLRAPYLERIWGAELVAAFRTVKETLDPRGILNPGVILPLEDQDPLEGLELRERRVPS